MDLRTSRSLLFNVKSTWPLTRVLYFHILYAHFLSHLLTFFRQSLWRECLLNCQLLQPIIYWAPIWIQWFPYSWVILSHVSWLIIYYCHLKFTEDWHRAWAFRLLGSGKPKFRMSKSWIHFTFMMHHFNLYSCIVPSFDLICPWQCQ